VASVTITERGRAFACVDPSRESAETNEGTGEPAWNEQLVPRGRLRARRRQRRLTVRHQEALQERPETYDAFIHFCLSLPYLTFWVGRLLHLPSAEAVSVRPNAQPRCNQKVTVIGCEAEKSPATWDW